MKLIPLYLRGGKTINAASAISSLMRQGKHPCCDVEEILRMMPAVDAQDEPFQHDDYAVQPQVEIGKWEL